ncbi:hypothetical protein EYF80_051119 [Liparis tanakae]|uniref:Uncharacterized protein n=1 Tax=Liparis tanakae TaxID=230148 RepID=A0A4Z2FD59_9TELE|nr:hypothetical protein EYF80_051119 [Liparis tanakae]
MGATEGFTVCTQDHQSQQGALCSGSTPRPLLITQGVGWDVVVLAEGGQLFTSSRYAHLTVYQENPGGRGRGGAWSLKRRPAERKGPRSVSQPPGGLWVSARPKRTEGSCLYDRKQMINKDLFTLLYLQVFPSDC